MAVELTSSWNRGKADARPGSQFSQLMSSQGTHLGKPDCNSENWHVTFRSFSWSEDTDPIKALQRLCTVCYLWLRPDIHTKEQILDKLVLEQFMVRMPVSLQILVTESGVKNCQDLEEILRNNRRSNPSGQKLLPETISIKSEPESLRSEKNLGENLMQDRKRPTLCDAQEPQLLKGPADSVGANDGKNPEEGTSIKNVDTDTPPVLVSKTEVSTPGRNREESQENMTCSKRKLDNSFNAQEGSHETVTHSDKIEFLARLGLRPVDSPKTMGPHDHDLRMRLRPTKHNSPRTVGPTDHDLWMRLRPTKHNSPRTVGPTDHDLRMHLGPTKHDSPRTVGPTDHTISQDQKSTRRSPYQCKHCKKTFNYKSQFDIHQRTHTGERPFKCSSCGKGFMQPSDVRVHQRIHTGEKPFKCEICHREFTHESTLHGHKRVHTNEKPYQCTVCGKRFSHKGNLNVHQRIHTGAKPYVCPQCGHTFRQLGTLQRHKKMHL